MTREYSSLTCIDSEYLFRLHVLQQQESLSSLVIQGVEKALAIAAWTAVTEHTELVRLRFVTGSYFDPA